MINSVEMKNNNLIVQKSIILKRDEDQFKKYTDFVNSSDLLRNKYGSLCKKLISDKINIFWLCFKKR